MKLLLDTTYFLPAIGVSIEKIPQQASLDLIRKGHEIFICDVTIFELSAKGGKHFVRSELTTERVLRGIRSIIYDERVGKIPFHETPTLQLALKLREHLEDFIDCLILSSAINHCDTLVTEDYDIQGLTPAKNFQELLEATNPAFKICSIKDL